MIPVHSTLYNKVATRMLNSQSLSYNQKLKLWKEQKEDKFKEIAMDKSSLFNYFYTNNDLFKFIDEEDFLIYSFDAVRIMDIQSNIFIGCFITVVLVDRLILNRFFPRFRFKQWRLTANLIKYIFWPLALFKPLEYYSLEPEREEMFEIQQKYNFGFQDYLKGNKIFQRALAVNRLEQLLEKREDFDWTGVPQLL